MFFKAVIFDLDGTLLDTLNDLADSMNNVLKRYDLPIHNIESYKYMIGDGVESLVRRALPWRIKKPETVSKLIAEYRSEYEKNWKINTRPYYGINELITLIKLRNLKLAVLSNKPNDSTEMCVREFLPFEKFDIILGHRPGYKLKPDPGGAVEISLLLEVQPEQILYLGDTGVDMQTAVAANMYPVGALWGFRTGDELKKNGAKILIEKPYDLLKLLDKK